MLNSQGHLTEGTICNVFFVLNKRNKAVLCTPSLDCRILDGIKEHSLRAGSKKGIAVKKAGLRKKIFIAPRSFHNQYNYGDYACVQG